MILFNKKQKEAVRQDKDIENENGDYTVGRNKKLDTVMKFVAVLVAFMIWAYVANSTATTSEVTFNLVSIEVKNKESLFDKYDLVVQSINLDTLNVTLMGRKSDIDEIKSTDIKAYINLGSIEKAGEYKLDVMVDLPQGITCTQTVSQVDVTIDTSTKKEYPITGKNVLLSGWMLENGYYFGDITTTLTSVTLEGASNDISKVEAVAVKTGPLGAVTGSVKSLCEIVLLDVAGKELTLPNVYITPDTSVIEASISVYKEKTVPVKIVTAYGYINNDNITVTPSSVLIKGEPSHVDAVSVIEVGNINEKKAFADSRLFIGSFPVSAESVTIFGADGKSIDSVSVKIDLTRLPVKLITGVEVYSADVLVGYTDVGVAVKNDDANCRSMLGNIKASDIKAYTESKLSDAVIAINETFGEYLFDYSVSDIYQTDEQ